MDAQHWLDELNKNQILRNVQKLLETQTEKGIQKYGTTVTPAHYTFTEWLEHLQQEMIDAVVYCEVLKFKYAHLITLEKLNSDVNIE
ncbi:hypothetical protein [Geobacillus jurassicus]|uniref:Uncharacterized protein n=1 Tax=Geobacillus jurassicus TaxID=235932 RepID=A0ABV6GRL0_9BACL|nr:MULTISPECIES: hypothetical protein [Geobacillus]MBW7642440.1 hypothetical protein [Geobacillus thermoleovorans]